MTEQAPKNDFQLWMDKLGYHRKQVSEAATRMGIRNPTTAGRKNRGETELTDTERLAMSAARAGLPPWTPGTDQEIAEIKMLRDIIDRAAERMKINHQANEA